MNNNIYVKKNRILKYLLLSIFNFFYNYESKEFRNLFEIVIPVDFSNDNNLEFETYLPNNLNINDKNKISQFIKKNNKIFSNNNFYRLTFSKNGLNSNVLENIEIIEYNPTTTALQKPKTVNKKKEFFQEENFIILNIYIPLANIPSGKEIITNGLSSKVLILFDRMLKDITSYIRDKYKNTINGSEKLNLKILYNKNKEQIIGFKFFIKDHEEILYVFYTSDNNYFIFNKEMEIIHQFIISLQINGPILNVMGKLGNLFGVRKDPFTGKIKRHRGQDIPLPNNTPLVSVEDGVIVDSGYNKDYGYFVIVHHGFATKNSYSSVYCHLNKILYPVGTKVLKNQIICLSGNTGRSTGPHLHFEIVDNKTGERINPLYLHKTYKKINVLFFDALKEYFLSLIDTVNNNF
jgi:murein DD-endopeptidase MepM/ murein hydrolase activator NlpD